MKLLFLTIILFLLGFKIAKAQDLIVTGKGDSLNCKITKVKGDFIYFTFKYENEIRNTLLSTGQIKIIKKNFYAIPEVPADKIKNNRGSFQKLRIGVYGGWSRMTARTSDDVPADFKEYVEKLKSGKHFGGDFNYFISENIGFGLNYSMFRTGNELSNIWTKDTITGKIRTGMLKDDITIQYFGPSFCTRFCSASKNTHFIWGISMGYLSYKNNVTVIDDFTLTSSTIGFVWHFDLVIAIDKNIFLGISFKHITGSLNYYDFNDGSQSRTIKLERDQINTISRIDLSVGIFWIK